MFSPEEKKAYWAAKWLKKKERKIAKEVKDLKDQVHEMKVDEF